MVNKNWFRIHKTHCIELWKSKGFIGLLIFCACWNFPSISSAVDLNKGIRSIGPSVTSTEKLSSWPTNPVFFLNHGAKERTLDHDYFWLVQNPGAVSNLLYHAETAHINKVVPHLRKAIKATNKERVRSYYKYALKELDFALARVVNHPRGLMLLPLVAAGLGKPDLPNRYYQRALSLYPKRPVTQAQYGKYLVDRGELKQGTEHLLIAVKLNPKLRMGYAWLSVAYEKQGKKKLSLEFAQKAKALQAKKKVSKKTGK